MAENRLKYLAILCLVPYRLTPHPGLSGNISCISVRCEWRICHALLRMFILFLLRVVVIQRLNWRIRHAFGMFILLRFSVTYFYCNKVKKNKVRQKKLIISLALPRIGKKLLHLAFFSTFCSVCIFDDKFHQQIHHLPCSKKQKARHKVCPFLPNTKCWI